MHKLQFGAGAARYGAAWAAHDLDAIRAMHTADTVSHLHGGGEPAVGLAATREAFAAAAAQSPDIRFEKTRVYIGPNHFVSECEMSGSSEGKRFKLRRRRRHRGHRPAARNPGSIRLQEAFVSA